MSRLKVMTIVGTRPEIIRLSRVIARLDQTSEHLLVHTGQNYDYELNQIFFDQLGIPQPAHFLAAARATPAETIGHVIIAVDALLEQEHPDAVLVLGDTNSCLAVIAAKRRRIPIFHMEAGNRCFDMRVPEEINRRIVDHVSDINLCYSEHARRYLLAEGIPPDRIIKTGSPLFEVIGHYRLQVEASDILSRLELSRGGYFVVSLHREENVEDPARLRDVMAALDALVQEYGLPVVFSLHPRTRRRLEALGLAPGDGIRWLAPLGLIDYLHLQLHSFCTLSDSGTITEESAMLGFAAVNLRDCQERPEGMDEAAVLLAGTSPDSILRCVTIARLQQQEGAAVRLPEGYDHDDVSWKVVKLIHSYTDYVNRTVWKREPSPSR